MSNNSEYLKALVNGGASGNLPEPTGTIGKYLKALADNSTEDLPEPNSVIGEYLKALVNGGSTSDLPKPNSTTAKYLEYLVKGGDINELPKPNSIIGEYLYQMCGGVVPTLKVIDVGKGDEYAYHSIKEAEKVAEDGTTIRIHEGVYEEYGIGTVSKNLTYEGVNKDTCIVQNGLSDKMYSVFDVVGGKAIKNLTIHQTHSDPQNPNTESVAYKAYCVHVDSETNAGHTTRIENCILKNRYFACTGIGMWQDSTVILKGCTLDLYDSNRDITNTGAFYCHSNTYSNGITGQRISLINNTIHAYQSKAIRIDTASQDGSEMICEFINNTCSSDLYGTTAECVDFSTNEHTILAETSAGNNIAKLNYGVSTSYTEPDGLKDTGYWFVAYDKTADKWYAVNSVSKITNAYKNDSTYQLMMTIENGNAKNNGWISDDGITWTKKITDYIEYKTSVRLKELNKSMYNNNIEFVDAWSDTEFTWNY